MCKRALAWQYIRLSGGVDTGTYSVHRLEEVGGMWLRRVP